MHRLINTSACQRTEIEVKKVSFHMFHVISNSQPTSTNCSTPLVISDLLKCQGGREHFHLGLQLRRYAA